MDEKGKEEESLMSRIEQLQRERDELRKDIEQLCMQQAGPGYLAAATRMHFQRTAGLEQEIESLKKKLAGCTREKQNLQEELSEAYRIKGQLADLHNAEVLKNKEAEKQLKFFQSCVAAAFAERDNALMELEKAKEPEEAASQKVIFAENRVEELQLAYNDEKKLSAELKMEIRELREQNQCFEKVIDKFYEIRERDTGFSEDTSLQGKCSCLLDDPLEKWIFNSDSNTSTSKYIASLEEQLEKRKKSIDKLQSNLRMGLEIEQHLKRNIRHLEKKRLMLVDTITDGLSSLRAFHNQQRLEIMKVLEEQTSQIKSVVIEVQEKMNHVHSKSKPKFGTLPREQCDETECRDVHITSDVDPDFLAEGGGLTRTSFPANKMPGTSDALAQALQEKVAALLLLSQQEERQILEGNVNKVLQEKIEELQRSLSQATSEKVKALMELAQLKREYQILQENSGDVLRCGNILVDNSDRSIMVHGREGKLKNILKRTYLKHWIGKDLSESEPASRGRTEESSPTSRRHFDHSDYARLKVENAALQESMANMEHLTSSIRRLRFALLKIQEDARSAGLENITEALSSIIAEANHVKTALGSSLPVSWSADAAVDATTYENLFEPTDSSEVPKSDKVDLVSTAGMEMVELLILATELLKKSLVDRSVD